MTALIDTLPMSRAAYDRCLVRILGFAVRHPEIEHCIRQRVGGYLYVSQPSSLEVGPFTGGRHETLVDIVLAARKDHIPVKVEIGDRHVCVELDFGLVLRAIDYRTTFADDSALESLATCTDAHLKVLLRNLATIWEAGS